MPLRVDTSIPYGNACDLEVAAGGPVPEVRFTADPHGGPECLWFCFRVVADRRPRGGRVRLVLKHPENLLGGSAVENMRPVLRTARADWQRLGPGAREELPDGRHQGVWTVEVPRGWFEVAFCYPYGMPEVRALLQETGGAWQADAIGVSQAARPILRLSNSPGEKGSDRPGLYLVARQHSGETPGSWVLDGLLRHMATYGRRAPLVWAVPLTNIDGVEQGDYGKDNFPWDLNRAWGRPPMRHEVMVMQRDVARWRARCRPALGLDFHAPGGCETDGTYFYMPDPEKQPAEAERARRWTAALAAAMGPFAAANCARVARYPSRWETPSFRHAFEAVQASGLCLETPYALAGETVLTRETYREIGRRLADGIVAELGA